MNTLKTLQNFIKRNIPIIVIAIITLIIFAIIILLSSQQPTQTPRMIITEQDENINIEREILDEIIEVETDGNIITRTITDNEQAQEAVSTQIVDEKFLPSDVIYTEDGFEPRTLQAVENQLIRITNQTNSTINLRQVQNKYSDFENGIIIASGQTYQLRLYKLKLFTLQEERTKNRIFFNVHAFSKF